jgi:hypothetical protein
MKPAVRNPVLSHPNRARNLFLPLQITRHKLLLTLNRRDVGGELILPPVAFLAPAQRSPLPTR